MGILSQNLSNSPSKSPPFNPYPSPSRSLKNAQQVSIAECRTLVWEKRKKNMKKGKRRKNKEEKKIRTDKRLDAKAVMVIGSL
jgi:hypothetical protein